MKHKLNDQISAHFEMSCGDSERVFVRPRFKMILTCRQTHIEPPWYNNTAGEKYIGMDMDSIAKHVHVQEWKEWITSDVCKLMEEERRIYNAFCNVQSSSNLVKFTFCNGDREKTVSGHLRETDSHGNTVILVFELLDFIGFEPDSIILPF